MKVKATFREILHNANWDKFCDLKGLNPYMLKEGLADGDEETELTLEECKQIGLRIDYDQRN